MTSLKTSIKTITYLSDIGCLEIQGASLAMKMGMSVLRICLSRPKGLIHENAIHSLALASTESMVESIRNIHAEDKIFSIFI
ncbi:DNA methylase [Escherichia coli]|nr:DNA methylase [Escherichia coli]